LLPNKPLEPQQQRQRQHQHRHQQQERDNGAAHAAQAYLAQPSFHTVRDIEANDIFLPFSISNCSLVLTKSNLRATIT